ncbi:hypothetical protein MF628_000950 [Paenibacillus polymyxa]|uniref:hypothetical protein n=1 Tax=Paenibacillus polymyxa TaxID=1406 RepID=UPI002025A2DA|nr:hypothetical protein [Paenibacillus polymyxa]URJ46420.1 hypothetical protein MF628_000950 [Paenibacillus polymyxa]
MELIDVSKELYAASNRLGNSADALFALGRNKAETERDYRSLLAQEMLKLKHDGMSVTLIPDIAKGNVSEKLFERDFAEAKFQAGIKAADAIKVQVSALQTILKYHSDIGG